MSSKNNLKVSINTNNNKTITFANSGPVFLYFFSPECVFLRKWAVIFVYVPIMPLGVLNRIITEQYRSYKVHILVHIEN